MTCGWRPVGRVRLAEVVIRLPARSGVIDAVGRLNVGIAGEDKLVGSPPAEAKVVVGVVVMAGTLVEARPVESALGEGPGGKDKATGGTLAEVTPAEAMPVEDKLAEGTPDGSTPSEGTADEDTATGGTLAEGTLSGGRLADGPLTEAALDGGTTEGKLAEGKSGGSRTIGDGMTDEGGCAEGSTVDATTEGVVDSPPPETGIVSGDGGVAMSAGGAAI